MLAVLYERFVRPFDFVLAKVYHIRIDGLKVSHPSETLNHNPLDLGIFFFGDTVNRYSFRLFNNFLRDRHSMPRPC